MIYWGDETGVSNCETMERGFAPKGHPPILPVETKRERVNMLSAINEQGGVRFMVYQGTMDQQRLIQFLRRLLSTARQKIFLILDNLKVHHGKLVAAWLEKHREKIEVFFLPPYAPEYNPDEYLNHGLKLSVHTGQLPHTAKDITHKIHSYMRMLQHNPSLVARFFLHPRLSYLFTRE